MNHGWDMTPKSNLACAIKSVPDKNTSIGILSFGFCAGTIEENSYIGKNAESVANNTILEILETAFDIFLQKESYYKDLRLAELLIKDSLKKADIRLQQYSNAIARGVFAGGCIFYSNRSSYIVLPFGGGSAYLWDGFSLSKIGGGEPSDHIVRDAVGIGSSGINRIIAYNSNINTNNRIILTSKEFDNLAICGDIIKSEQPNAPLNATAKLLRRELQKESNMDCAVIDIFEK